MIIESLSYEDAHGDELTITLTPDLIEELEGSFPVKGFTPSGTASETLYFGFVIPNEYVLTSNSQNHFRVSQVRGGLLSSTYNNIVAELPDLFDDKAFWVVDALVCPGNGSLRDTHNYYPSVKPFIDALTRSGKFFTDDNFNFVSAYMGLGVMMRFDQRLLFTSKGDLYKKPTRRGHAFTSLGFIIRIQKYSHT